MKKILFFSLVLLFFTTCKKGLTDLLFSTENDKTLGQQTRNQILSDPAHYLILDRTQYATVYSYLENMRDAILNSGKVTHKDNFEWTIYVIKDDNTLNAFCTPGGYIFIYTGLIKYLDNASSLAGVLGHEMGHADNRHSVNQMIEQYGIQLLLDVVLGKNQNQLTQIASSIVSLKFSRSDETDADNQSVICLCPTIYRANGAQDFFVKINNTQQQPEFLSTHPSPTNRIQNINTKATELKCNNTPTVNVEITNYNIFKNALL